MQGVRTFLESSTIHGLSHVLTTKKLARLFWIFTVLTGFSVAGYLIHLSIKSWSESPEKTTIETLPIAKVTFPTVTVCPPKNTITNLNYDFMMAENKSIPEELRNELFQIIIDNYEDKEYEDIIDNLEIFNEKRRFSNWYNGNTKISIPKFDGNTLFLSIYTSAISGRVWTQYFGQPFDKTKINTEISLKVRIIVPYDIAYNESLTFYLDHQKLYKYDSQLHYQKNITPPYKEAYSIGYENYYNFDLEYVDILQYNIPYMTHKTMPGMSVQWSYNQNMTDNPQYSGESLNSKFVRLFNIFLLFYKRYHVIIC